MTDVANDRPSRRMWKYGVAVLVLLLVGYLLPEPRVIPVAGATSADWHKDTFWFEPWGSSGVHKGMDIFAAKNTPILATTHMLILYRGEWRKGGKVVIGLGPKWRLHYFAHLNDNNVDGGHLLTAGSVLGYVGDSGNARGKPAHLHYAIVSLIPIPWHIDNSTQGYKKAFYLDPVEYLR